MGFSSRDNLLIVAVFSCMSSVRPSTDPILVPLDGTGDITDWLIAWRTGNTEAADRLMPLVATAMRLVAARQLGREAVGHTLTPTALVNEAWLRLTGQQQFTFADRTHFLSVVSRVMRRVLVDYARRTNAIKRDARAISLASLSTSTEEEWALTMIALDDAMERLAQVDARLARVVDCRFFSGLTEEETAAVLDISVRTVHRDWLRARAWLEIALRE